MPKKRSSQNQTSFKKGNKNGHGVGSQGQLRRDITVEIVSQLNEFDHHCDHLPPEKRLKLSHSFWLWYANANSTCQAM